MAACCTRADRRGPGCCRAKLGWLETGGLQVDWAANRRPDQPRGHGGSLEDVWGQGKRRHAAAWAGRAAMWTSAAYRWRRRRPRKPWAKPRAKPCKDQQSAARLRQVWVGGLCRNVCNFVLLATAARGAGCATQPPAAWPPEAAASRMACGSCRPPPAEAAAPPPPPHATLSLPLPVRQ